MSDSSRIDRKRRILVVATASAGVATAIAAALPLAASMLPSERARALGAPVEVDISQLSPGEKMTVAWRGQPVWILHRTKEMLADVLKDDARLADPDSKRHPGEFTPPYARNEFRSIRPEYLVVIGICTHLGCSPQDRLEPGPQPFDRDWNGGFYCPCHGSLFDLAGRVYKNKPAPDNLKVPPHMYLSDDTLRIGEHQEKKA